MDARTAPSTELVSRLGSSGLVAGGALSAILAVVMQTSNANIPPFNSVAVAARAMSTLAGLLLILGLPVLAAHLGRRSPMLAVTGLVFTIVSILIYDAFIGLLDTTVIPYLLTQHVKPLKYLTGPGQLPPTALIPLVIVLLVGGVAHMFGAAFLGIAAYRTHAVSRLAAGLLLASSVLFLGAFSPIEWFDVASDVAMMAGLVVAGLELLGVIQRKESRQTAAAGVARG